MELCVPWGRSLSPAAWAEPENPPGQGVRGASNKHSSQVVETNEGQSGRPPVTPKLLKASSYHLGRLMEKGLSLLSVLMAGFCFCFYWETKRLALQSHTLRAGSLSLLTQSLKDH